MSEPATYNLTQDAQHGLLLTLRQEVNVGDHFRLAWKVAFGWACYEGSLSEREGEQLSFEGIHRGLVKTVEDAKAWLCGEALLPAHQLVRVQFTTGSTSDG